MPKLRILPGLTGSLVAIGMLAGCSHTTYDWEAIREDNMCTDLEQIYMDPDLPNRPLVLADILEVASRRNVDLMVKELEISVQREVAQRELWKMLPSFILNGEASGRTEGFVETSKSLVGGVESPGSIARETATRRWDATAAFNLLDFGLAFYRSRQERHRELILAMEFQRVRQNLTYDIVNEYWKAMIAKRALDGAAAILMSARERRVKLDRQLEQRLVSEIDGLQDKDQLLAVELQMQSFSREFQSAKSQLAALMGIPPETPYELAPLVDYDLPESLADIEEMEQLALQTRPELYAQDIQEEIMADEVRAAIVEMFPNATLFVGRFYDGDRFLVNNDWISTGIRASWNLLSLPQHAANKSRAEEQEELARQSRLALSIGVMAQVHLANLRYEDAAERFALSQDRDSIRKRMLEAARRELREGIAATADVLDYEIESFFGEVAALRAYGEIQIAIAQLNNAIGAPMYLKHSNVKIPEGEWQGEASADADENYYYDAPTASWYNVGQTVEQVTIDEEQPRENMSNHPMFQ